MTTDITELAQSLKRRATSANDFGERLYVKADDVLALVEVLEKAQQRITQLESRTVKMPEPFKLAKSSSGLTYYFADDVDAALTAAGIKWEAE
ncbi:hypothetical protein RVR16_01310 [Klebsiella michiganensis]|uniref:hypothetical protein n=1 Tax=Klebsiella michiganensis TaxID=1134687 RepID=UPI001CCC334F|nr:hypothetical protein [Klebsiella michiganensis]MBZ7439201.1 hypothetical protein [Klebsiella michiganensis]MDV0358657.1 hypothetical protein [Klebsiella michiganensis]